MNGKLASVFALAFLIAACGGTQNTGPQPSGPLFSVETSHGYGLIDSTGTVIVEPQFSQRPEEFRDGLSVVRQGETYGLIDSSGHIVILGQAERIDPEKSFGEGLAAFHTAGYSGYIDRRGNVIIPADTYRLGTRFSEGLAGVMNDSTKWGFIDTDGSEVIPCAYEAVSSFVGGIAGAKVDGYWGIIDTKGRMVLEPRFRILSGFSEGLVKVLPVGEEWGIIDTTGRFLVEPEYTRITTPYNGIAIITKDRKSGLLSDDGRVLLSAEYTDIKTTHGHTYWIQTTAGTWGIVDAKGNWLIEPRYDDITLIDGGPAIVREGNRFGLVMNTGRVTIEPQYAGLRNYGEGYVSFSRDGEMWGYVDTAGTIIVEPRFSWCGTFSSGLAWFNKDGTRVDEWDVSGGTWGWIDTTGAVAIEPRPYDRVGAFQGDVALVLRRGLWGVVNRSGDVVVDPIFDYISIENGLIRVEDRAAWDHVGGYINYSGRFIWRPDEAINYKPAK